MFNEKDLNTILGYIKATTAIPCRACTGALTPCSRCKQIEKWTKDTEQNFKDWNELLQVHSDLKTISKLVDSYVSNYHSLCAEYNSFKTAKTELFKVCPELVTILENTVYVPIEKE